MNVWLGGGLPPMGSSFLKDFTTRYMDPTEVYARFEELADEFPNIARLVRLPYRTNGYQRRAQATMAGTMPPGNGSVTPIRPPRAERSCSRPAHGATRAATSSPLSSANPGVANSPLSVNVIGKRILVSLATDAAGAPSSTAQR